MKSALKVTPLPAHWHKVLEMTHKILCTVEFSGVTKLYTAISSEILQLIHIFYDSETSKKKAAFLEPLKNKIRGPFISQQTLLSSRLTY